MTVPVVLAIGGAMCIVLLCLTACLLMLIGAGLRKADAKVFDDRLKQEGWVRVPSDYELEKKSQPLYPNGWLHTDRLSDVGDTLHDDTGGGHKFPGRNRQRPPLPSPARACKTKKQKHLSALKGFNIEAVEGSR